jgi:hypothetical protein
MKTNWAQDFSDGSPDSSGASAFSVSKSDVDKVCKYILNQPGHHKKQSFSEEYEHFLKHYQDTIKK